MAFTCGFFNSENGDRKYNAEQMSAIFDGIIADGVFTTIGDHMAVSAGTGMQVLVGTGKAWFDHTWNVNDAAYPLAIAASDVTLSRIDAIVLETNHSDSVRLNKLRVVQGTVASSPVKPTLTNSEKVHQHPLAWVTVAPGVTKIAASAIENAVGTSACPFVTGIIATTAIDDLFNQWNGEFDEWFDNLKAQLSDNVVANLQRQIDECKTESRNHLKSYTKGLLGLSESSGPDDAFTALAIGSGYYAYRVKVQLSDGTPVEGAVVSGIEALAGKTLTTDSSGMTMGRSTSSTVSISASSPYIDQNPPPAQNITASSIITDVTITLVNKTTYDTFTSSTTINPKFSKMCKSIDICAVGGGCDGNSGNESLNLKCLGGYSGAGGYSNKIDIHAIKSISMIIGSASGYYNNPTVSSFTINSVQHTFNVSIGSKSGGTKGVSPDMFNHGGPGQNGFHIFGDTSLPIVGSSGGAGGYYNAYNYSPDMPFSLRGGSGGANAGSGGYATGYYDTEVSYNKYTRYNGTSATGYGCGGGGGVYVGGNGVNLMQGQTYYSRAGQGKQGAAFIRYNFT